MLGIQSQQPLPVLSTLSALTRNPARLHASCQRPQLKVRTCRQLSALPQACQVQLPQLHVHMVCMTRMTSTIKTM